MERGTWKKHYATKTMDIYSFMARMLFFLPGTNRKMLRYYGIADLFKTSCFGSAGQPFRDIRTSTATGRCEKAGLLDVVKF